METEVMEKETERGTEMAEKETEGAEEMEVEKEL